MSYQQAVALMAKGRANPSDYMLVFPNKVTRFANADDINEYISFFTRAVTIPASNNSVMSLRGHENVGIARNVITGRNFGSPVVATFTDRADLLIYNTMKGWLDSSVVNSQQLGLAALGGRSLRCQYYNVAKCDIELLKLEPIAKHNAYKLHRDEYSIPDSDTQRQIDSRPNYGSYRGHTVTGKWTFLNCLPIGIEQTTMAMESADSLLDFTVSFGYESFSFEEVPFEDGTSTAAKTTLANRV